MTTAVLRAAAVVVAMVLSAAACSTGDSAEAGPASTEVGREVHTELVQDWTQQEGATGPLALPLASRATALPGRMLRPLLETSGYQGAYSRVWTRDGGHLVSVIAYRFLLPRGAERLVSFAAERLSTSDAYVGFQDAAVPGSRGYQLVSTVQGRPRFCVGEWFAVDRDAFVVTRCAPYPLSSADVTGLAQRQLVFAVTGETE